ncbi:MULTISPECIES: MauE/DoxX family redox-associated membrane protein [Chryseobacterium]|uniref:Tellurium resistance protein TerC n=1 Tax=Candidatus Chryseobacterium massiliense TaxID=204089 RepID=A0A3D9BB74_9FLAO|nr:MULTISPECIES: MauE/DoxX family redox-associated membrane protein [Chryseobacterium]REC50627.1 tellurium resistance protein TerC [Candidatus Chryseobacterium massiliae]
MKKLIKFFPDIVTCFFVLLFCYAAISKILDFENFQVQIGQSPLLSAFAEFISYAVIVLELIIVLLLLFPIVRRAGLYASTALMSAFTVYIFLILNYSDFIPCSCGGILEKLGWTEHLIFNIVCVIAGILAILMNDHEKEHPIRKTGFIIVFSNIVSCVLIVFLFFSSEYIIKKDNNFTRRFLIHPVVEDVVFDLKVNSFYFAGSDENNIYLGNHTAPLLLTSIDHELKFLKQRKINLVNKNFPFRNLQVQVFDKRFYLYDGTVPVIYRGDISDLRGQLVSYNDAYFTQLVPVDTAKFALRTQSRTNQNYTLALLHLYPSPKVYLHQGILQKQIDGVFDSDGNLLRINNNGNLVYSYSYRNQFMVMNRDMKLLSRLKTIDTVGTAQIKVTKLADGRRKMSAPPVKINKGSTANRNLLFIHSASMAKNESAKAWDEVSVVDMYFLNKQEYAGSFYIKNRKGAKLSKMIANDQYLFVLMGTELIRYRFTKPIKKLYRSGEAENLQQRVGTN